MALVISAYTVSSTPRGFYPCEWPATSLAAARRFAQAQSVQADRQIYPNAWWVSDGRKTLAAFLNGEPYQAKKRELDAEYLTPRPTLTGP